MKVLNEATKFFKGIDDIQTSGIKIYLKIFFFQIVLVFSMGKIFV